MLGQGHLNLAVQDAKLDVLCEIEPHAGYDELIAHTEAVPLHGRTLCVLGLARLIEAKAAAGRPKDRLALPILIATLESTKKER